jgi:xanthine dehydrogenase YagS FAD-binding subunit
VDLMKLGVETPGLLVDVNGLLGAAVDELPDGSVRIGAGIRNSDLARHPLVRERFPALSQAVLSGASGQLRNMATAGGNLLQRTRCTYFQDVTRPCNKREPGSGCPARAGAHRYHAILGASPSCIATHPSDFAVGLAAFDAIVNVRGPDGARSVPLGDLHRLPGDDPARDTTLQRGELIVSIDIPPLTFGARSSYRKVRDRASFAFALVAAATALDVDDGVVRDVRIALGGVAAKPWRALVAERLLRGGRADAASYRAAIGAELASAQPMPESGFKVALASRLVVRALEDLTT